MAFDYPNGTYTIASIPLIAVVLILGWFGVRKRVNAEAMKEHEHHADDQDDAPHKLADDNAR
jgi:L-asparagine permease